MVPMRTGRRSNQRLTSEDRDQRRWSAPAPNSAAVVEGTGTALVEELMSNAAKKGQSGNPSGRPQGSRNKVSLAIDALLDGDAEKITRKAIEMALAGEMVALRLCLDRLAPARTDRPVLFGLPPIASTADLAKASAALLAAVATGELTPSEAAELGKLVEAYVRAVEVVEIQERLLR
jgi:hypothetical protein